MAASLIKIIGFTLLVIESLIGIVANGFIVLMNYIDWFKNRKLSPADLILTCLGLSRLAWQAVVILDETILAFQAVGLLAQTMYFFSLGTHIWRYLYLMIPITWTFTNTANVWFATWLSVFYFAKIANFSHPVFLQVKQRISGLVPWLLLGSIVVSAITTLTVVTSLRDNLSMCDFYSSFLNINGSEIKIPGSCRYFIIVATAPNFIPLQIFLSSSILLITSLWKHTRHLRHNGIGVRDLNTQAHLTAIKALTSFSVLYLSSFLAYTALGILLWSKMDRPRSMMLIDSVKFEGGKETKPSYPLVMLPFLDREGPPASRFILKYRKISRTSTIALQDITERREGLRCAGPEEIPLGVPTKRFDTKNY
uniref:taste receptor type 2 member 7-like n=1 Tax=Euleptes europaea TaxID=460621 RepID=UPI002541E07E|nr:taste receptor type 2 member 7-like [Euleptes europaea]